MRRRTTTGLAALGAAGALVLFNGDAIVPSGNANLEELNDPAVNTWLADMEATSSTAARAAYSAKIDMEVMKQAVILPASYSKALLYPSSSLTNVYVQAYYGMYDYGVLGMKP